MAWKTTHPNYSPPKGAGWGGPAKGASRTKGLVAEFQPMSNDPEIKARQAERAARLHDMIYGLAVGESLEGSPIPVAELRHETRLAAAIAFLDRVEGKPVARSDTRISGGEGGPVQFTWMPPTE